LVKFPIFYIIFNIEILSLFVKKFKSIKDFVLVIEDQLVRPEKATI